MNKDKLYIHKELIIKKGCLSALRVHDDATYRKILANSEQLFTQNIHKQIDFYNFDNSPFSFLGIRFVSFRSLLKRFNFSQKESEEALTQLKYYIRLEGETRNLPESIIRSDLERISLNKNGSGLRNTARMIFYFIIALKNNDVVLAPDQFSVWGFNTFSSYQIINKMIQNSSKSLIIPEFDASINKSDLKIKILDEENYNKIVNPEGIKLRRWGE